MPQKPGTLAYASETWNTTNRIEKRLITTQRAMERRMVNISKRQHIKAETIREMTGVKDVIHSIYKNKHRWAGHVARTQDNRWTTRTTYWCPYGQKRKKGRPNIRWEDPLLEVYGPTWSRIAKDRKRWKSEDDGLHHWRTNR